MGQDVSTLRFFQRNFSEEEAENIRKRFSIREGEDPDKINKKQVQQIFHFPDEVIENVFRLFDKDNDGLISFREFGEAILMLSKKRFDKKVKAIFKLYAVNKKVTSEEMFLLFKTIANSTRRQAGLPEDLDKLRAISDNAFQQADINKSNRLNFREFLVWSKESPEMKQYLSTLSLMFQIPPPSSAPSNYFVPNRDNHFRILSIDGGGIKGLVSAVIIARIESKYPGFLDSFDMFAGSSVGSILALAYAYGYTAEEVKNFFLAKAPEFFDEKTLTEKIVDLGRLAGPQFTNESLKRISTEIFGSFKLSDLRKKALVTTFHLSAVHGEKKKWKPKIFHNFDESEDNEEPLRDLCVRSMSAPTYFPSYQGFIDGSLVANNPAMCAVSQAVSKKYGKVDLDQVLLFSVGAGEYDRFLEGEELKWGLAQWARSLFDILISASEQSVDFQCRHLLRDQQYYRIDIPLSRDYSPTEPANRNELNTESEEADITSTLEWIEKFFFGSKEQRDAEIQESNVDDSMLLPSPEQTPKMDRAQKNEQTKQTSF